MSSRIHRDQGSGIRDQFRGGRRVAFADAAVLALLGELASLACSAGIRDHGSVL
jgi:hypothetical protein